MRTLCRSQNSGQLSRYAIILTTGLEENRNKNCCKKEKIIFSFKFWVSHEILHKPSASVKFWPKSFHKSSVIFDIFCITNYAWFWTVLAWQTVIFVISGYTRSTEYKIQLHTISKLLQLYIHLVYCGTYIIYFQFCGKF